MKYSGIGGQAVIEGIMMKNKDDYAVAVRKPDGQIEVQTDRYVSMTEKVKFFSLPFIRGVFSFADSMILGMRALTFSTSFFEDDEDSSPPGPSRRDQEAREHQGREGTGPDTPCGCDECPDRSHFPGISSE